MSNEIHTPGPWTVYAQAREWPGIDSDTMSIIIFGEEDDLERGVRGESFTEAMANARLIAAAPDLLAVAEKNLEILQKLYNMPTNSGIFGPIEYGILEQAVYRTRAAIAAAKGEK